MDTDSDAVNVELLTVAELMDRFKGTGLSVRTLRFYTSSGLIDPPIRVGRRGLYGPRHLKQLHVVIALRKRQATLAEIAAVVGHASDEQLDRLSQGKGLTKALAAARASIVTPGSWTRAGTATEPAQALSNISQPFTGTSASTVGAAAPVRNLNLTGTQLHSSSGTVVHTSATGQADADGGCRIQVGSATLTLTWNPDHQTREALTALVTAADALSPTRRPLSLDPTGQ